MAVQEHTGELKLSTHVTGTGSYIQRQIVSLLKLKTNGICAAVAGFLPEIAEDRNARSSNLALRRGNAAL